MPHLAQRRLFVIEGIQQSENNRRAGIDGFQESRKEMRDCLLHLVTGKTPRHMDCLQHAVGVGPGCPGRVDQGMHVEPVAPIGHRDTHSAAERIRRNGMGQLKHRFAPVQEVKLAGRKGKLLGKKRVRLNCFGCRLRRELGG